jgi:hypothetical protein
MRREPVKIFSQFTDEDRKRLGPPKTPEAFSTEHHEYVSPFNYVNVTLGNFAEYDTQTGMELIPEKGFITIEEQQPIVAVTVVGSGCCPKGYVVCEYGEDEEKLEDLAPGAPKRQQIDNLNGIHFDYGRRVLMGQFKGESREQEYLDSHGGVVDWFSHRSGGFYGSIWMGVYENTAFFRVERTNKITIRAGSLDVEDPYMPNARYPGEYSVRIIETTVVR